jgi:heme/copper-type cytochrome/quinol oxidase subunit 2
MQTGNTRNVPVQANSLLETAAITLSIGLAVVLVAVIVSHMGLLNGLMSREIAGPPAEGTIHIVGQGMQFSQTELRVPAGEPVTLQLDNKDLYGHSFDIDALDVHVRMPANGRVTATFAVPEPGT